MYHHTCLVFVIVVVVIFCRLVSNNYLSSLGITVASHHTWPVLFLCEVTITKQQPLFFLLKVFSIFPCISSSHLLICPSQFNPLND
jgi:hypothetical protein